MDLELSDFDATTLVREVIGRFQQELDWGRQTVTLDLGGPDQPDKPIVGRWDRLRLDQVVSNLISNAMKYGGDKKRIEIRVAGSPTSLSISVRDHGVGISTEDQERIFERFERLISVRHFGGFGLGLWIVRQIVEAHGGRVHVSSALGEGSTFTVEVPLTTALAATRGPRETTPVPEPRPERVRLSSR